MFAGLFAPEQITAREADAGELRVARAALEVTEPALYLEHAPGSAERYARVMRQL